MGIFNLLALGVFYLQCWDYKDRGIVPSDLYKWGIAYYIFYIAAFVVIAAAVLMFIHKKSEK